MAEILNLQEEHPDVPKEEKASHQSWGFCHNSYRSFAFCLAN
ncbi:MAG: hypothetical protein QM582_16865 [Micropruina sp.]